MTPTHKRFRTRFRLWAALAVIVLCTCFGIGAYAVFSTAGTMSPTVEAGTVQLEWNSLDTGPLSLPVGPLRPGGTAERLVDLENTGTVSVSEIQLVYAGDPAGPAADLSDGLQVRLDKCSIPWGGTTDKYTCLGQLTVLAPDRPIAGRTNLTGMAAAAIGGTDHLRFTFQLPASAPEGLQNASGTMDFSVLGNQRPGQHR